MKVTHAEVMFLDKMLEDFGDVADPWAAYGITQNRIAMEPVVKAVRAAERPSADFAKFEDARRPLLEQYAAQDADGNAIMQQIPQPDGSTTAIYRIEDPAKLATATKKLQKDYPGVVEAEEERRSKLQEVHAAEVDVTFVGIKMSDMPEGLVHTNNMRPLLKYGILNWDLKRDDAADCSSTE